MNILDVPAEKGGIATIAIEQQSPVEKPALLSPLTLAFIGDGVYELLAREHLAARGSMPAGKLHKLAVELVRASAQARLYNRLEEENLLTEQEFAVMKRGRNNNSCHCPKNADPIEYRKATGIEALFGYLYLERNMARLDELFRVALTLWEQHQAGTEL